jgi:hypothetical protein
MLELLLTYHISYIWWYLQAPVFGVHTSVHVCAYIPICTLNLKFVTYQGYHIGEWMWAVLDHG